MLTLQRESYFFNDRPVYLQSWSRRGGFSVHAHEFLELVLITGGRGIQEREGGADDLAVGDVLVIRVGDWHSYHHAGVLSGIDCAICPTLMSRELAWTATDPRLGPLLWGHHRLHRARRLRQPANQDLSNLFADPPQSIGRAGWIGRLLTILDAVGEMMERGSDPITRLSIHAGSAEAARLMEAQPNLSWTLGGLALRVGLRPEYLCRVFARDFGMAPRDWLLRRRVQLVQQRLLGEVRPLSSIAQEAGWSDAAVCSRFFRRVTGLSPSAWRKRYREQPGSTL